MEEKNKKKVPKIKKEKKVKPKKVKNVNKDAQSKKKDTKMKFKYKHPKLSVAIKIIILILLILFVIGAGIAVGLVYGLWGEDFTINMSELIMTENSVIIDSEGNVLAELNGDESRKIITLEEMPIYLQKAYISIEDERFEKHSGVDIKRTGAAILSFITHGGKSTAGGGSTITQQLVKNVTKDKDDEGLAGVFRKLKEWTKAYQVEQEMSKDQILELYLNLIFVGGKGNHGVEMGAQYYFNKSAKDLSIAQCAFLAGINHSPNKYNPYSGNDVTERIAKRTKTVLNQMKKFNYVTQEEYDAAVAEVEAGFKFENGAKGNVYSSHTDALLAQLISQIMEEKQISEDAAKTYLYSSGLTIYSTQVTSIQNVMESVAKEKKYVLKSKKEKNEDGSPIYAQAAMVVIEPSTGKVVGCIGQLGEKTTSRGQNRATQSTRGTGSSFKPLATLVPGIEEGVVNAATVYDDSYTIFNKGTALEYDPKNYNRFTGLRSVRSAVTTSQNIPFIKIMAEVGNAKCLEYLRKMGITSLDDKHDSGLAAAIGGLYNGVSPLEMAGAYASIANNGTYIQPTFYSKVEDAEGNVVLEPNQKTERVCSEDTAYVVKSLLTSVVKDSGGTAKYCAIKGIDVAAKTGTTNTDYDRWLCGFTNYYAGAAWFGFDKQEDVDFSGNPAGQIWAAVMSQIHKGLAASKFEPTSNIVTARVCRDSGKLAGARCTNTYSEIFVKEHLPDECDAHTGEYTICSESGKLPNEYCPQDKLVVKYDKYIVEKERLGIWYTANSTASKERVPTEYCDIHKKIEIVEPEVPAQEEPTQVEEQTKPEETEKPEENTNTSTNSSDAENQEKPENNNNDNDQSTDNPQGTNNTRPGATTNQTDNKTTTRNDNKIQP